MKIINIETRKKAIISAVLWNLIPVLFIGCCLNAFYLGKLEEEKIKLKERNNLIDSLKYKIAMDSIKIDSLSSVQQIFDNEKSIGDSVAASILIFKAKLVELQAVSIEIFGENPSSGNRIVLEQDFDNLKREIQEDLIAIKAQFKKSSIKNLFEDIYLICESFLKNEVHSKNHLAALTVHNDPNKNSSISNCQSEVIGLKQTIELLKSNHETERRLYDNDALTLTTCKKDILQQIETFMSKLEGILNRPYKKNKARECNDLLKEIRTLKAVTTISCTNSSPKGIRGNDRRRS